jgi:hypothetical protein
MGNLAVICLGVGLILAQESVRMIFPDSRRMGLRFLALAIMLISTPITIPLAASFFKPVSIHDVRVENFLRLPSPKIFFPVVVLGAAFFGIVSVYRRDAALCGRLNELAEEIEDFRLERAANAPPMAVRVDPSHGLLASMGRRSQQRAAYLRRFKKRLTKAEKEIAARILSGESDLLEAFLDDRDLESVERYLTVFAKVISKEPKNVFGWAAIRTSGALVCFPTLIWIVWAILGKS